jgi:flagellar motor switch protein FliN
MDDRLAGRQQELITGLASELAGVASALLGSTASPVPATAPLVPGWRVTCSISGPMAGSITVAISDEDATALARRLMGMDEDPPADAVIDTLGEVVGQAVGGLGQRPAAGGARIRVEGSAQAGAPLPASAPSVFDLSMEDGTTLRFGCWVLIESGEAAQAAPNVAATATPATVAASPAGGVFATPAPAGPPLDNLDVILDIELPLVVRFGRTELTLQALAQIGPGSVIDLDRSPDEPVEVLINEKVIARGEVVVVAGNYGVRVTEVTSAADRIRSLGQ